MLMAQNHQKVNPAPPPGPAYGGYKSPVVKLFCEWKVLFDFVEGPSLRGCSDEERAPYHARETEKVRQLLMTPSRDARDVCAKLTAFTYDGQQFADDDGVLSNIILREARDIVGNISGGKV